MLVVRDTLKPATSAGGYPVAEALFPATLRTAEDKAIEEKDDFLKHRRRFRLPSSRGTLRSAIGAQRNVVPDTPQVS